MCKTLLEEGAKLNIYDPKVDHQQILEDLTHPCVTDSPEYVRKAIDIFDNAYDAVKDTYAIVLCTEWDEFVVRMNLFSIFFCYKLFKQTQRISSFLSFFHTLSFLRNWTTEPFTVRWWNRHTYLMAEKSWSTKSYKISAFMCKPSAENWIEPVCLGHGPHNNNIKRVEF